MCQNTVVFDIDNEQVLNEALLPGVLKKLPKKQIFWDWMGRRYSEKSNTFSRQLRGYVFGQGNRSKINVETRALSLSDCYWLMHKDEIVTFESVSPYFNNFWKGEGPYEGGSIPTLYVNGYLPKQWLDKDRLYKSKEKHEVMCYKLCDGMGIPAAQVEEYEDGIVVYNFTTSDLMFEPADSAGLFDPEDFTPSDLFKTFGLFAYDMLFIDALTGNGDRHSGNFGFLRNANTGEYVGHAPLFDFDHAFGSKSIPDVLINEVNHLKTLLPERHKALITRARQMDLHDYFRERLEVLS